MTITKPGTYIIKKTDIKNYITIRAYGGAGKKGEGEFGGEGGYGEVKQIMVNNNDDITLKITFGTTAKQGKPSEKLVHKDLVIFEQMEGGSPGKDAVCEITAGTDCHTLFAFGGGGGGGGGNHVHINMGANAENTFLSCKGGVGGENHDSILKFGCIGVIGGRGQDGDSDSVYSAGSFVSEYDYNEGDARVEVDFF